MLWTELFFSFFSIGKKTFAQQMLARFGFLFLIWLVGLLAHAIDGVSVSYTSDLNIYQLLFGTSFLILLGSYKVQLSINDLIPNIRPMLKLDEQQFRKLSERMERYTYSVFPCILIASGFIIFSSDVPNEIQQALTMGIELHAICMLSIAAFVYLLIGTAFWMFMSIWLIVFFVSRQPLNVKLSPKTIETFRGLSMLALWFSLGYFLAISIGIVVPLASAPATSLFEIVVSPLLLFLAVGIIGILFPFYNIHKALLKLKKQELLEIEEESERLLHQLDEILAKEPARESSEETIATLARLFRLQIKEKRIKSAQEWPIDTGFLSKLAVLILIPIIVRAAAEIFSRYF